MSGRDSGRPARTDGIAAARATESESLGEGSGGGLVGSGADAGVTVTTRVPLTGPDLYDWIALRRVSGGGVVKLSQGGWVERGRRVPGYVAEALTALCQRGLVTLSGPDPLARAVLTDAGAERYQRLCQQRQRALQAPAP